LLTELNKIFIFFKFLNRTPVAAVHAGGPIVHTSFAGLGASYAW